MLLPTRRRHTPFAAALLGTALTLAACGSATSTGPDNASASAAPASSAAARTTYPLSLNNCGLPITVPKAPERVLILNGTSVGEVESFILLGLEDKIVANAQSYGVSDDPAMVDKIKAIPTGGLTMNKSYDVPAEQVLALKPDLVVSTWSGGFDAKSGFATRAQLAAAGIGSLVNPVNCSYGKPDATAAEKQAYSTMGLRSSLEFITLLGQVFDVQDRAAAVVADLQQREAAVTAKVAGTTPKHVLIAFPGMSMMNANGLPAVMSGGIYDDLIKASGGVNTFEGKGPELTGSLNAEQLAAAQVDVLVVASYMPGEKPDVEAAKLFAAYPQWAASKTKTFVAASDGVYLGPLNPVVMEKIAKAAHPDKF